MVCEYKAAGMPYCFHGSHCSQMITEEDCESCPDSTELNPAPKIAQRTSPARTACAHLGSKRKCCESLFICRKLRQDCVKTSAENVTGMLCCETCEHFEALGPS